MDDLKDFFERLSRIMKEDGRYKEEAYLFVMASLGRAIEKLEKPRHLSGEELLSGIRDEAEQQFGPMAQAVFEHWGIKNSLDFGHIVFNMVHEGVLSKTESDSLEDFRDAVFFQRLFNGDLEYRLQDEESFLAEKQTKVSHK